MAIARNNDEHARIETALAASVEEYRTIFAAINEGYCVSELIFNDAGAPVDLLHVKTNSSFERLVGIENTVGKTSSELFPNFEPHWLEPCIRVIATGESERYEDFSSHMDRWFDVSVSRIGGVGSSRLAIGFNDTTERKRAEISVRESEARQAFLLKLSDVLRPLADSMEIQGAASRLLGEQLGLTRCGYAEMDFAGEFTTVHQDYHVPDVAPFVGTYRLDDFGSGFIDTLRRGETLVINDVTKDPAHANSLVAASHAKSETRAMIATPLVKEKRLVAVLFAHLRTARQWTSEEVALVTEVAERTWAAAERARAEAALIESEAKHRTVFEKMSEGFVVLERVAGEPLDYRFVIANPAYERHSGLGNPVGKTMREIAPTADEARECYRIAEETGLTQTLMTYVSELDRWFEVEASSAERPGQVAVLFRDITERRRTELAVRENQERQAFLLKLSDALRAEPDAEAVADRVLRMLFEHMRLDRCYIVIYRLKEDKGDLPYQVHDDRLSPLPAQVRLSDFPKGFHVVFDRTLVIDDVMEQQSYSDIERANVTGLGLRAVINATLRKGENKPLWAIVAGSMHPRAWTQGEVSLVEEVAERIWAAVERARAEAALRDSEAKYRTIFDSINQGFYIAEGIQDETGRTIDRRLLEVNPAFENVTGLERAVGKLMSQFAPRAESKWNEAFDHVVRTGEPRRVVEFNEDTRRWYQADHALIGGPGSRLVGVVFDDITERKRAEMALRESEERQAFLLDLSDALRAEPSAEAVADRALRMLFAQMGLDRCYIGIYRLAEDVGEFPHQVHDDCLPPMPAEIRLSDFPESLKIAFDRTLVINNVVEQEGFSDSDRASVGNLGLCAFVAATLRKGGNNPLWAIVAGSMHPRAWTSGEVALVEEVAERTWAAVERARAEVARRDSEERFREFSDASTNVLWIRDTKTMQMEFASPAFDKIYGTVGSDHSGDGRLRSWARLIKPENRKSVLANFRRVRAGERVEQEFQIRRASDGTLRWIHDTGFPLRDANGEVRFIAGLGADITDAKETADRQGVLVAELQHRTRNLIAVVRALADRTLGNAASVEDFGARFRLRLSALSRVQGLLSHLAAGERVTFKELLCSELAVYGATNGMEHKFTLEGPDDVLLPSRTVQTFALAIHELATNALKYGALAAADGHLFVGWRIDPSVGNDPPCLHVEWRESGVTMPDVGAPARGSGYGRELIERALPYQLKAKTTYELGVDGVRCTIAVPISRTTSNGIWQ